MFCRLVVLGIAFRYALCSRSGGFLFGSSVSFPSDEDDNGEGGIYSSEDILSGLETTGEGGGGRGRRGRSQVKPREGWLKYIPKVPISTVTVDTLYIIQYTSLLIFFLF